MCMSKLSIFATFALSSCMSLSHDIASELTNAQKTKHQTKIEKKISEKKSNLAFNVASTAIGLAIFTLGTTSIQNPSRFNLLQQAIGAALTGGGIYFGLHDTYNLLNLKKKLAACSSPSAQPKSLA